VFGKNPIRRQHLGTGLELEVQSIFSTIQGEGPFTGQPAVFLRLAGCNLRCHFCDTDFESRKKAMNVDSIVREIQEHAATDKITETDLVVVTGGEPLLQNIVFLCDKLSDLGFRIQIETAGTVWVPGLEDYIGIDALTIVCSPKTGKVHEKIAQHCWNWKYLIREGEVSPVDGLPIMSTQEPGKKLKLYRPEIYSHNTIWLQPCEEYKNIVHIPAAFALSLDEMSDQKFTKQVRDEERSQRNIQLCGVLAMKYNYRVSLQLHKFLRLP